MASFDTVNYSLRPSKGIQRQLVFEGVRSLQAHLDLERLVYVGFGSIWFTDFLIAHKLLGVEDMVSIEANDIGFQRASFNSPYATVRVKHGNSYDILPTLYADSLIGARPWLIWLDYDYELNESLRDDIRSVVEKAPMNSLLLVTFNGLENRYGHANQRPARLRELLGAVVPDELDKDACKDEYMQETLASLGLDFISSIAADVSRPGGFVPAFRLIYRDNAPMVTIGGILPAKGAARTALEIVSRSEWCCCPSGAIKAPHLTIRESASLQAQLPCKTPLTRAKVRELGFDLEDDQIAAFEKYYRQYPSFAQIVT